MQKEGPTYSLHSRQLRLSRVPRPDVAKQLDERIPLRRILFWVAVWLGIFLGIAFYFTYARLLTPLLG